MCSSLATREKDPIIPRGQTVAGPLGLKPSGPRKAFDEKVTWPYERSVAFN
jgi:hypothetical protein